MLIKVLPPIINERNITPKLYKNQQYQKKKKKQSSGRRSIDQIESVWEQNLGQLVYQLDPDTKKLARKLKKKIIRS